MIAYKWASNDRVCIFGSRPRRSRFSARVRVAIHVYGPGNPYYGRGFDRISLRLQFYSSGPASKAGLLAHTDLRIPRVAYRTGSRHSVAFGFIAVCLPRCPLDSPSVVFLRPGYRTIQCSRTYAGYHLRSHGKYSPVRAPRSGLLLLTSAGDRVCLCVGSVEAYAAPLLAWRAGVSRGALRD